jgi:hypothetical protein
MISGHKQLLSHVVSLWHGWLPRMLLLTKAVRNIPYGATERELREFFSSAGEVVSFRWVILCSSGVFLPEDGRR